MTAPERISLLPSDGWSWCEGRPVHEEDAVEYIRADLLDAAVNEALERAKREARTDALREAAAVARSKVHSGTGEAIAVHILALIEKEGKP